MTFFQLLGVRHCVRCWGYNGLQVSDSVLPAWGLRFVCGTNSHSSELPDLYILRGQSPGRTGVIRRHWCSLGSQGGPSWGGSMSAEILVTIRKEPGRRKGRAFQMEGAV